MFRYDIVGFVEAEQWKPVLGWEDLYVVSNRGRVMSLRRSLILSAQKKKSGKDNHHWYVNLSGPAREAPWIKVQVRVAVHTLVLEAFVGPRPAGMQACHWDDDGDNNHLSNLRWDTHKGNSADRERNNTHCPEGHEYTEENTYRFTRKDGRREKHCRQCRRDRAYERAELKRGRHSRRHGTKPSLRVPRASWDEVGRNSSTSPY